MGFPIRISITSGNPAIAASLAPEVCLPQFCAKTRKSNLNMSVQEHGKVNDTCGFRPRPYSSEPQPPVCHHSAKALRFKRLNICIELCKPFLNTTDDTSCTSWQTLLFPASRRRICRPGACDRSKAPKTCFSRRWHTFWSQRAQSTA